MIKTLCSLLVFSTSISALAQEIVNETPVKLDKNRSVFQIVNNSKKETTLFVSDDKKVNAILLNNQIQITDSLSTARPDSKKFPSMVGYNCSTDNAQIFWSSKDYSEIKTQLFDFANKKIDVKSLTLSFKDETILEKISTADAFFIVTIQKNSSILKIHNIDNLGNYSSNIVDASSFRFFDSNYKQATLYNVFKQSFLPSEAPFSLEFINAETPTSLDISSKKRKCYIDNGQLFITLDTNKNLTQLLTINLNTYTLTEKTIKKPFIVVDNNATNLSTDSNSFLFNQKLYQMKSSATEFVFEIKDLDGNSLKEYRVNENDVIDFKNSEISQEGSGISGNSKKTLEKTSQFIRKLNNLNPGISCYLQGENTLVTLGSISEVKGMSTAQAIGGQFGLIGALAASMIDYYNPTMASFNAYANRKVVKVDCLFDQQNNHVKSDLKPLAFDKIRTFFEDNDDVKKVSMETLFKMNDFYYLGYYLDKEKKYVIRKFAD
ncbi:hypothetical protein [Flavobacterium agrisoli]|uniref:Uncharacterized protein n=1 Tax=Flavobacterium agrisoli TaxID=2793066 RepID=A0A934UJ03_9FLAO|nr:hypothetical protein [Flavobacterium agrisoli]MBK0369451.1 hypothetical protein [Flavobacterium agrisoli]